MGKPVLVYPRYNIQQIRRESYKKKNIKMQKILIASAILATAFALPPPSIPVDGEPSIYAPEKLPPQPYEYDYRVADVTAEGAPVYPPEPKERYRRAAIHAPAYRPPAYKPA